MNAVVGELLVWRGKCAVCRGATGCGLRAAGYIQIHKSRRNSQYNVIQQLANMIVLLLSVEIPVDWEIFLLTGERLSCFLL